MKIKIQIVALAALLLVTGCKTSGPGMSRSIARAGTSSAVLLAALKEPHVVNYVQAATPIICQASGGTNRYSPQDIVDALNSLKIEKNPTIIVLVNAILSFYSAAYEENRGTSSPVLEGICLGLQDSLAFWTPSLIGAPPPVAIRRPKLPPHIE